MFQIARCSTATLALFALGGAALAAEPRIDFDDGWAFARSDPAGAEAAAFDDAGWSKVDLPHDWSIAGPIARDNPAGSPGGFLPTGVGWYRKSFDVPADWSGKRVAIQFDGVYMLSDVYVNGQQLGTHSNGFTPFEYDLTLHLKPGAANVVAVRVDNSRQPNCRWYAGSGIYRHVRLDVRDPVHLARFGTFIRADEVADESAKLTIELVTDAADAPAASNVAFETSVFEADANGRPTGDAVARFVSASAAFASREGGGPRAATARSTALLKNPKRWSPESPARYVAVTVASSGGREVDRRETTFGVRTIEVSADKGFLLNGKPVELYGACVHDDNGPLGVAAFDRAEARRAEQLKAAGFNAVRCAHNPPAPAFLDACDRLGLLVIDETFDSWSFGKLKEDGSRYFDETWQSDLDGMILRDRNHPSVVMWSLGNEIHDFGSPQGLRNGTKLVARARELDPTRPVTTAVYWFKSIGGPNFHWEWPQADELMSRFDVVGYNYAINRYEEDHRRVPGRILVGSESYPHDLFVAWEYSTKLPYVLGDFVWTGIDYLGESGIGRYHQPDEKIYFHLDPRHYPYHGAYCGDIDLTGFRKPVSHERNIVWDRGETLYASVFETVPDGRKYRVGDWGIVPTRASWTRPGFEGKPREVQVYSRHDAVRLYLNDKLVGERPTTQAQQFKATFEVPYEPGTLRAVGVRAGREVETFELRTAGPVAGVRLTADRTEIAADGQDLAYVTVEAVDAAGNPQPNADAELTFAVDGPATIAGAANGDLGSLESYQGNTRRLFNGRALLVLRSTKSAAPIIVRASGPSLGVGEARIVSR